MPSSCASRPANLIQWFLLKEERNNLSGQSQQILEAKNKSVRKGSKAQNQRQERQSTSTPVTNSLLRHSDWLRKERMASNH